MGLLGRAAGEGLRGGAVGTHLLLYLNLHRNPSAQLTQGGLRNACSSLEVEKPWGTLGAGWKPRKNWLHREHSKQHRSAKGNSKKGGGASGTGLMDAGGFSGKRCRRDPRVLGQGPMVTQRGLQRAHKRNFLHSKSRSGPPTLLIILIK